MEIDLSGASQLQLITVTAQALYERDGWRRDTTFLHYEYELPREDR
jgi:hypothetical protein